MSVEKKTHGGSRAGSGRRKLGKVTVRLCLKPATVSKLAHVARAQAVTRSEVADRVLSEALK